MASVLLTRPRAAAERMAAKLRALGYTVVIEPLLTILPTHQSPPDLAAVKAVMITSSNALAVLDKYQPSIASLLTLPCFCVGSQTAETASAFGFSDVHDAAGDGATLAQMIGKSQSSNSKLHILHIAGTHIDSLATDRLQDAGFSVSLWPVYRAEPAREVSPALRQLLEERKLDAVMLFSVRTATILATLLARYQLEACCAALTAIGISQAVVDVVQPLPWLKLSAASRPTEDSAITSLQTLLS